MKTARVSVPFLASIVIACATARSARAADIDRKALLMEALTAARQIRAEDLRSAVLSRIAALQASIGDIAGGKSTVAEIKSEREKADAYGGMAVARAEQDDIEAAKSLLELTTDQSVRPQVYFTLAKARALKGEVAGAKAAAERVTGNFWKGQAIGCVALAQINAGETAAARATVATIETPELKAAAYCRIAVAQARRGDRDGARQSIELGKSLSGSAPGASTLIPAAQIEAGDLAGALATATSITDAELRSMAYLNIADVQLDKKDIAGANITSAKISGESEKMQYNLSLSVALAKAGNAKAAAQWLDLVKGHPQYLPSMPPDSAFDIIASAQTAGGDAVGAIAWARSLKDPGDRARALCGVVAMRPTSNAGRKP